MNKKILTFVLVGLFLISISFPVKGVTIEEVRSLIQELINSLQQLIAQTYQPSPARYDCFPVDPIPGLEHPVFNMCQPASEGQGRFNSLEECQKYCSSGARPVTTTTTKLVTPTRYTCTLVYSTDGTSNATTIVGTPIRQCKAVPGGEFSSLDECQKYCPVGPTTTKPVSTPTTTVPRRTPADCPDGNRCAWSGGKCVKLPPLMISSGSWTGASNLLPFPTYNLECICSDNNTCITRTVSPTTSRYTCSIEYHNYDTIPNPIRQCRPLTDGEYGSLTECQKYCSSGAKPVTTTTTKPVTTPTTTVPRRTSADCPDGNRCAWSGGKCVKLPPLMVSSGSGSWTGASNLLPFPTYNLECICSDNNICTTRVMFPGSTR